MIATRRQDKRLRAPSDIVGGEMVRYQLECPECEARFDLAEYAPEKRVRCRSCKAVVVIPYAPGDAPPPPPAGKALKPELRQKVVRALSLKKLGLVASLLAVATAGGVYILLVKRDAGPPPPPAKAEERVTLEKVSQMNRLLVLPLGAGFSWEYGLSDGGTEVRQIVQAGLSPAQEPEYDLVIRGSSFTGRQTLRMGRDGIYLAGEIRSDGRREFNPPLLLLPHPMYSDVPWTQESEVTQPGGGRAKWKVDCNVTLLEQVETPAGKFPCFRAELKGVRDGRAVEEVHWYAKGVGLVKRRAKLDAGVEEAVLRKYTQKR
jgi:hypothetical protein